MRSNKETCLRGALIWVSTPCLFPQVRIHWTGCPNSCGQAQVGDIGLIGSPAKKDGKAVQGVSIIGGGTIGEGAKLASTGDAVQRFGPSRALVRVVGWLLLIRARGYCVLVTDGPCTALATCATPTTLTALTHHPCRVREGGSDRGRLRSPPGDSDQRIRRQGDRTQRGSTWFNQL